MHPRQTVTAKPHLPADAVVFLVFTGLKVSVEQELALHFCV